MMERLTYKGQNGKNYVKDNGYYNGVRLSLDKTADRLAAYEDTGLAPDDMYAVRLLAASADHEKAMRLCELAEMDAQGRLVVLPCKVGDKAYWVHGDQITNCKVYRVQINRKGMFVVLKSKVVHGAFNVNDIGKTVFLTREEAEQALKGGAD